MTSLKNDCVLVLKQKDTLPYDTPPSPACDISNTFVATFGSRVQMFRVQKYSLSYFQLLVGKLERHYK